MESGGKMETKAKYILVMVAMCILITPAFSQGGERDGRNGNPGSNNAMMSGPNGAPFGQVATSSQVRHLMRPDSRLQYTMREWIRPARSTQHDESAPGRISNRATGSMMALLSASPVPTNRSRPAR